ncbi:MAG TPA: hypothetical protein VJ743_13275 [Albitalea sp.]|nr:hypothetical protein [Albitalea sp.]
MTRHSSAPHTPSATPQTPQSSGVDPRTTPQESGHQIPRPDGHPQGEPAARRSSGDTDLGDSGRVRSPHGGDASDSGSASDEDARSRRRDLGR